MPANSSKQPTNPKTPSIPRSNPVNLPAKIGRPSSYSPELGTLICERLAQGESMAAICRDEAMPGLRTVWAWLDRYPSFQRDYARAREQQAEFYSSQIVAISDAATPEDAQVARLRVDARKWVASKLLPKVYGERVAHQVEARVETTTTHVIDLSGLAMEELLVLLQAQQKLPLALPVGEEASRSLASPARLLPAATATGEMEEEQ